MHICLFISFVSKLISYHQCFRTKMMFCQSNANIQIVHFFNVANFLQRRTEIISILPHGLCYSHRGSGVCNSNITDPIMAMGFVDHVGQ